MPRKKVKAKKIIIAAKIPEKRWNLKEGRNIKKHSLEVFSSLNVNVIKGWGLWKDRRREMTIEL